MRTCIDRFPRAVHGDKLTNNMQGISYKHSTSLSVSVTLTLKAPSAILSYNITYHDITCISYPMISYHILTCSITYAILSYNDFLQWFHF